MKKLLSAIVFLGVSASVFAHSIEFDKITHWSGSGPNRAALVIQFGGDYSPSDAYVWGFRWEEGENPTGEDMVRAICEDSSNLVVLTQITGQFGSTLCGVGVGNASDILENIYFDFEMAIDYPFITFDYYNNNSWFGQAEAPGENTPEIMQKAIEGAKESHVIQHPLDYFGYGYPAYDYDCWKMNPCGPDNKWQSGWYEGYWSFWLTSSVPTSEWLYSGTGFTGTQLQNETIHGWTFTQFEEAMVGGMGEGNPPTDDPQKIIYIPSGSGENAGIESLDLNSSDLDLNSSDEIEYYTLSGKRIYDSRKLKGIVIIKQGDRTYKKLFK